MSSDGYARHTPLLTNQYGARLIVFDLALLPHLGDLLGELVNEDTWFEVGSTIGATVESAFITLDNFYSNPMVGSIQAFLGAVPAYYLELDGATYDQADYPELANVIDTSFRNDQAGTFTLPDLQGRVIQHIDAGEVVGDIGGLAQVTLTTQEIPSHSHTYTPPVANIDLEAPGAPDILAAGLGTPTETGVTGGGEPHENKPPYLAVRYAIFAGR